MTQPDDTPPPSRRLPAADGLPIPDEQAMQAGASRWPLLSPRVQSAAATPIEHMFVRLLAHAPARRAAKAMPEMFQRLLKH